MPKDAVYVGPPGILGNPFLIGIDGTAEECCKKYHNLIMGFIEPNMQPKAREWMERFQKHSYTRHPLEYVRMYLKGKDLACWCQLDKICHRDVLLKLANQ